MTPISGDSKTGQHTNADVAEARIAELEAEVALLK